MEADIPKALPEFVPKTELAARLYEIQQRIVARGEGLMTTEEINAELDKTGW